MHLSQHIERRVEGMKQQQGGSQAWSMAFLRYHTADVANPGLG